MNSKYYLGGLRSLPSKVKPPNAIFTFNEDMGTPKLQAIAADSLEACRKSECHV